MASDTDTAKADPGTRPPRPRKRLSGSRLGALILALNLLSLLILFVGGLLLNEWRRGLVEARMESLSAQAELLANVLSEANATQGVPYPALDPIGASIVLRDTFIPRGQRARLYDVDGFLVLDSYQVSEVIPGHGLPPARPAGSPLPSEGLSPKQAHRAEEALRALDQEVALALKGEPQATLRRNEEGERVVSVSIPIRHVRAVLGVLTLEAGDVDETLAAQRLALLPFAFVALGVSLLTSLLIHLFVVRPIERLATAADQVRLQRARAISMPDLEDRKDEIGGLARSLETMTATLSDRMDAIEAFAADVSHEIKNPLTSIRSALETLELVKDPAAKARLIGLLQNDVRRLDRLITDISNASRLDAELSRDPARRVDLGQLLGDIVELYGSVAKAGEATVAFQPDTSDAAVIGREGPLGQVFRNLIDNARSFSPPDAEVQVRIARDDDERRPIVVTVEDKGPGIPAENLETVFERFYTSRPKGTAFGGNSGLGLSIARQIVEAHAGRIHAENMPDGGARFTVRLPPADRS